MIPNSALQQWHQAITLAKMPLHALVWAQQFRCSWRHFQNKGLLYQAMQIVQSPPQLLPSIPRNNDKNLHRLVFSSWSQLPQNNKLLKRPLKSLKITLIHIVSTTGFNHIITALSSLHQHKHQNQVAEASLLWIKFKLFFGRVLVTLVFWWVDIF